MSEYKTIRVKAMNYYNYLNYLKENQCINCFNYHGENHDYKHKSCERCMARATNFKYISTGN